MPPGRPWGSEVETMTAPCRFLFNRDAILSFCCLLDRSTAPESTIEMAAGARGSGKIDEDQRGLLTDTYGALPPSGEGSFMVALLSGAHWHIANTLGASIFYVNLPGLLIKWVKSLQMSGDYVPRMHGSSINSVMCLNFR